MRRVLIVVEADPRDSPRALEGLRMSVGLTLAENRVEVLARGAGKRLLEPGREAFPDHLRAREYLAALRAQGAVVSSGRAVLAAAREADVVIRWDE
ncbi:MAG: hypothetical protein ACYS99_16955 [Planctomycetota bacterium]